MTESWSNWKQYKDWQPDFASFQETLDGGQAFCWHSFDERSYEGVISEFPLRLRWEHPDRLFWSACALDPEESEAFVARYLGTASDYRHYYNTLPWRSDRHLQRCMKAFPKLRILKQPAEEALLGYLCSATKQITQIKAMLHLLRRRFGGPLAGGHRSLPTWSDLDQVAESDLRECKFGFRAGNIKKTAAMIRQSPETLTAVRHLPYREARAYLCAFPGVGEKVADCALLFGFGKLEAFPVDTWILKAMERRYGLAGWTPGQSAHFGRTHFGDYAGLAQQFLFAWERKQAGK